MFSVWEDSGLGVWDPISGTDIVSPGITPQPDDQEATGQRLAEICQFRRPISKTGVDKCTAAGFPPEYTKAGMCIDPCTGELYKHESIAASEAPCPRKVPVGGCPSGSSGPGSTPTAGSGGSGLPPIGTGGGSGGGGDTGGGGLPGDSGSSPLAFLQQSVMGVPLWLLGIGAIVLLKSGGRR